MMKAATQAVTRGDCKESTENVSEVSSDAVTTSPPTLEAIVQAICKDAKQQPLQYLLRSNTGHDGE